MPKFVTRDGRKYHRAKSFAWRNPKAGDITLDGEPVQEHDIVIVRLRDGVRDTEPTEVGFGEHKRLVRYVNVDNAPQAVKLIYTGTSTGYEQVRFHTKGRGRYLRNPVSHTVEYCTDYASLRFYLVHNGEVWTYTKYMQTSEGRDLEEHLHKRSMKHLAVPR